MGDIDYSLTIRRWRRDAPEDFRQAASNECDPEYYAGNERLQKLFRPTETE